MTNVLSLDTGLASFGASVWTSHRETHGVTHVCRAVEVFTSETRAEKWSVGMVDDLTRRGRELAAWFERLVITWRPALVLSEKMGVFADARHGISNVYVQALNSIAWGVVVAEVQRRLLRFATVMPTTCRKAICNRSDEALAQTLSMKRFPSYVAFDEKLSAAKKPHARDSLCVYNWGVITGLVGGVTK